MGEILFIGHRVPFPPDRGDKIRSHHVLKALAGLAPVHVACFADDAADLAHKRELAAIAASHCLIRRSRPMALAGLAALASGRPLSLTAFADRRLARYVARVIAARPIAAIYVFSGQMGQYVPRDFAGRVVMDLVDVDSAKFDAYAATARPPLARAYAREGRLLRREEQRLAGGADTSLLISAEEAALLRERLDPAVRDAANIAVMGNGVDAALFDPAAVTPQRELAEAGVPAIVFTGQMDYPPNVAAAVRAALRIMPLVRERVPGAAFHIVGRNPAAAVTALDGVNGTRVWGAVPDVRPFLRAATLALAPLDVARGVQNKVLEAMAMALPVVCSPGAATGIGAVPGETLLVGADDAALAAATADLLLDPARGAAMGQVARRFVIGRHDWPAATAGLARLLGIEGGEIRAARDAA